jgi:hypothetical protein
MSDSFTIDNPGPAALYVHTCPAQCFTHVRKSAGTVTQCYGQILHGLPSVRRENIRWSRWRLASAHHVATGSHLTSVFTERAMKHSSCAAWCMAASSCVAGR